MPRLFTVDDGSIEAVHVATEYKDGAAATPSLRTLGTGAAQAAAGDHAHAATYQPLDADLTAIAASPATTGLVERTGAATYATRLLGVANATDVPTRSDADGRYAVLASPTFTGVPAAPTAAPATNTTQIATTAFVIAEVAAVGGLSDGDKGDITVSGGGTTWTIDNGAVALAQMADLATDRLIGRDTAGSGVPEALTVGGGIEFTGTGIQRSALTGDVTASAGSGSTTIAARAVTVDKLLAATATSRVLGRKTGGSGDFEEVTASEILDFLSTTRGAILSRGAATWAALAVGTAGQVLKSAGAGADPAFAAPPAAGSAGQVQYHSSGDLAGASNVTIVSDNLTIAAAAPGTPAAGLVALSARSVGGRFHPTWTTPEGHTLAVEASRAQGRVFEWETIAATTTAMSGRGIAAPAATGTVTARTPATTRLFTMVRRLGAVSSNVAGNSCGWRSSVQLLGLGNSTGAGGFMYVIRFGVSDAATVANSRMFVGLIGITTAMANAEPSSNVNMIGVGCEAGGTTFIAYNNDAAGTATMSASFGASFPTQTLSTDWYELAMFAKPQATEVKYTLTRLNTGDIASGTWSSNLPAATQLLCPVVWRNNGATALAVGVDVASLYVRTDT